MILLLPTGVVGAATVASFFVVTAGLLLFATGGVFLDLLPSWVLAVLLATFTLGFFALFVFVCMAGRVTASSGTVFLGRPRFFASAVVAFVDMVARGAIVCVCMCGSACPWSWGDPRTSVSQMYGRRSERGVCFFLRG